MPGSSADLRWLTVIYRVPSKPSTLRVAIWKQAKELGGLALQQSTYMFPDMPAARLGLKRLQRLAEQGGGECTILEVASLDPAQEAAFIEELNRLRDEEYAEILDDYEELARRLERKTEREHFDHAEADDAAGDCARIGEHLRAIAGRDYFGSSRRNEAELAAQTCDSLVTAFSARVVAESTSAGHEENAGPVQPQEAKRIREQTRTAYDMVEAIARARQVLDEFEAGTLNIGALTVENTGGAALLELKYSDRNGRRCLEIEVEW